MAASWDLIAEPLQSGLADARSAQATRFAVKPAQHLADAPLLGAAHLATERSRSAQSMTWKTSEISDSAR